MIEHTKGWESISGSCLICDQGAKDNKDYERKPIREETFSSKLVFERNNFTYIDRMVGPDRETRDGPKGFPPSAIFAALLLMYLRGMDSVLDLVRF